MPSREPAVLGASESSTASSPYHSLQIAMLAGAAALIVYRCLAYLVFPEFSFDSDEAIIGLMAKHTAEGRAFPLFLYGQSYMLAVESWAAAPFVLVFGPTVLALRLSLLAWNLAFAYLLLRGLLRDVPRDPTAAFIPALFFLLAPVSIAYQLIYAQGGSIESFVYVAALWFLRRQPLWFGVVLGIGFRNREFTAYAVPALLLIELVRGELTRARRREWLLAMVLFFVAWQGIEALKPFADLRGPGTRGQLFGGYTGDSPVTNLSERFSLETTSLTSRIARMFPEILAWLVGARQVDTSLPISDHPWLAWVAAVACLAALGRLSWLLLAPAESAAPFIERVRGRVSRAPFALYLLAVGAIAIVAFVAGRPVLGSYVRYIVLAALFPVGLTAALLTLEPARWARRIVVAAVLAWAAVAAVDQGRLFATLWRRPPQNAARAIADHLVGKHISSASADYWRAYVVTFYARERVRVASRDFVRIQEYQDYFVAHRAESVVIAEQACPGGDRVAEVYLCKP